MVIEVDLRLFHFGARGFLRFLMDGHLHAMAVLFPCSLSPGFQEAVMRITLFHSFHFVLFLALWCITRGGSIGFTGLSWCKGTYAFVRRHRYTYGHCRNTVAIVEASDIMCRCILV